MRFKLSLIVAVSMSCLLFIHDAIGRSFFYPQPQPEQVLLSENQRPSWLRDGTGDDGYVRIDVSTSMVKKSCIPMGSAGFYGKIGTEAMQLAVSVKVNNLLSSLQGREIPIAIIDGRPNPGGCVVLTVLDSAMTIVPMARLESVTGNVGAIRIDVFVRSTSDSKLNIVGPAQAVLGVASVFATGGAATTVAGLTTALAQPALKRIEAAVNAANSGVTPGLSSVNIAWDDVRTIRKLRVPVFVGIAKNGEGDADAINRLQANNSIAATQADFFVDIDLHHFSTAFDLPVGSGGVPSGSDISSSEILRHPGQAGVASVAQLLDAGMSTLSKATSDSDILDGCTSILSTARAAGFSLRDRAIILFSAMERTRSSGWYKRRDFNVCVSGSKSIRDEIQKIYGSNATAFSYADARDKYASEDDRYASWIATGVPVLDRLKKALTEPNILERERVISVLSSNSDIVLDAPIGQEEWPSPPANSDGSVVSLPNAKRLASQKIKAAGCYTYRNDTKFDPNASAGEMLLLDANDKLWVASIKLASGQPSKMSQVIIIEADANWRNIYKQIVDAGLFGSPVRTGCASITSRL